MRSRSTPIIMAFSVAAVGCDDAAPRQEPEAFVVEDPTAALGKADGSGISPGMAWLMERSEQELAGLFADGTAPAIPLGENDGIPLLPAKVALVPWLGQLYEGSIWTQELDAAGQPSFHENGDPVVTLRDKFLRTPEGHLLTLFEGEVTRGLVRDVEVGDGIEPPVGSSPPHPLVPFSLPIAIDDRPSLFVNYHEDPTPIVNGILDEIRAVDAEHCPGLYLGRAHFLRPGGQWTYLYYFALDFGSDQACVLPSL